MGPGPAPRPYSPAPTSTPQGPDFKCEKDHSIRDCPLLREEKPKTSTVPPLVIHCADCGIKHFVQDCPVRPKSLGKVTLNFIETIPSTSAPSSSESKKIPSESEKIIPVKVITRAQAQAKQKDRDEKKETPSEKAVPSESSTSAKNSWKARRERRAASKKRKAEHSEKETKEKLKEHQMRRGSRISLSGKVL